jgi:hypothetical protein
VKGIARRGITSTLAIRSVCFEAGRFHDARRAGKCCQSHLPLLLLPLRLADFRVQAAASGESVRLGSCFLVCESRPMAPPAISLCSGTEADSSFAAAGAGAIVRGNSCCCCFNLNFQDSQLRVNQASFSRLISVFPFSD